MKKATLSIALFSLVVLTSFTTIQFAGDTGGTGNTQNSGGSNAGGTGDGQSIGGGKKLDRRIPPVLPAKLDYSDAQVQNIEFKKKSDI